MSYPLNERQLFWWDVCESNTAPIDYESTALTKHELTSRKTILTGMLFSVYSFEQLFSIAEMICFDLSQF